ncbi:uncharacterized protein (TIGR02680 family) [Haloactinospora alba]|uniref:Uncharacterized protein (TIGR02680 family) n=1 Tax=Haloactinospora alba TaxID=405555 RepID=A0A543NML5_9ACTN|nr:TIGR02680 family protein [Haloactinospora alba]TQN33071.1 uncharacterized protein (TIGR02680 family) [Haloactinospora alba]
MTDANAAEGADPSTPVTAGSDHEPATGTAGTTTLPEDGTETVPEDGQDDAPPATAARAGGDTADLADTAPLEVAATANPHPRYRLNRAGIQNVWQYDDHVFQFSDGRLLLRGRNGTGKSKALEMLLPFLLDGDARRLDTTGTSRTSLRWLMLEGRTATEATDGSADGDDAEETATETSALGYLWVEFVRSGEDGDQWVTVGAAVTATPGADARSVFFVTDRRVGVDVELVSDGRPMPIDRLRATLGDGNCYDSALAYRNRVMRELFGIDDPVRYRNLIHLLYRLRRPTIGERLEAGELVAVLAEALPPMDEAVLDQVARNVSDLEDARTRLAALRSAREQVGAFLSDYRAYLRTVLRERAREVREQVDAYHGRDAEVGRLESELDRLIASESSVQEERDRLRRTRDTAASDAATLSAGSQTTAPATGDEHQARSAAVNAYIRSAEAAWKAAEYALTTEEHAQKRLAADISAIDRHIAEFRHVHAELRQAAGECGIDASGLGEVPQPLPVTLAARESVTQVDLEGVEQAVERAPVAGIDVADLRGRLAELHDCLARTDTNAAERSRTAAELAEQATEQAAAERREAALLGEAEVAEGALESAQARERDAAEAVSAASVDYASRVREWSASLREAAPQSDLSAELDRIEERIELPLDDTMRVLDTDTPHGVQQHARAIVDPLLTELCTLRDTAVGEERELSAELEELSENRTSEHIAPPRPAWAPDNHENGTGVALYLAVDFAPELTTEERAGLEAALEASGLLAGRISAGATVTEDTTGDLLLAPARAAPGRNLSDVLVPVPTEELPHETISTLLESVALLDPPDATEEESAEPKHRRETVPVGGGSSTAGAVSLDGRWRLGVASGIHHKTVAEYIGEQARTEARDRYVANVDRRIAIAEALLAEAEERRGDIERQYARLVDISRDIPDPSDLVSAWAALDNARSWLAEKQREHTAAREAAERERATVLELRARVARAAQDNSMPTDAAGLAATATAAEKLRIRIAAAKRALESLAVLLEEYRQHSEEWERARGERAIAEDARTAAIGDMISVRRETELTDRARNAAPEQVATAVEQVRGRMGGADDRLPELERDAQRARDDRVAAETRLDTAVSERAEQARRALAVGERLVRTLHDTSGSPDPALLEAAGITGIEEPLSENGAGIDAEDATLDSRVRAVDTVLSALESELTPRAEEHPEEGTATTGEASVDSSELLRRREELHTALAGDGAAGARTELTEVNGIKRVIVHDDDGAHDVTAYAAHVDRAIAHADETALLREEEAFERHLLGELAAHLSQQIEEAKQLVATMNRVLGEVTTSQGLGVRLDWRLAPDADEDIQAVVPLLARSPEQRTRVETTRLRDALRRCIEAIRRMDPAATSGAQLRTALDYRSWFAFTVYVTDAARPERERKLSHRTALSQGEQRVVAYLVLFAAAAAQFDSLAAQAPEAPRLILLDDAFAKVDEPTHGRLLGLLVELDLDFVLTSERVWGCFSNVPSLHIYECLRDPTTPGIATLHFTWDGSRRRLVGV